LELNHFKNFAGGEVKREGGGARKRENGLDIMFGDGKGLVIDGLVVEKKYY
jgi:hypothetical protein